MFTESEQAEFEKAVKELERSLDKPDMTGRRLSVSRLALDLLLAPDADSAPPPTVASCTDYSTLTYIVCTGSDSGRDPVVSLTFGLACVSAASGQRELTDDHRHHS